MNEPKGQIGQRAVVRDTPFTKGWVGLAFPVVTIVAMPDLGTYWYETPRPDILGLALMFPEEWLDFSPAERG